MRGGRTDGVHFDIGGMMKKKEKIELVLIGAVVLVILFVLFLQDRKVKREEQRWIARPESGTKEQTVSLCTGDEEELVTITVEERKKTQEEVRKAIERTLDILKERCLLVAGEKNLWTESVVLPQYISETGVSIRWESSDETVLTEKGEIDRNVAECGQELVLAARLSYGEETKEVRFSVEVIPYEKGSAEALFYDASEALVKLEKETSGADGFYLPEKVGAVFVSLPKQSLSVFGVLAAAGLIIPLLVILSKRQEKEKERKKREEEFLEAYPRLITKLTLYTGAGLSLRGAWERMAVQLRGERICKGKKSALTEEILLLSGELQHGGSEQRAYEAFGKRVGLRQYMRLASLMNGHLQKGSGGLWKNLEFEAQSAWESHREHAVKKGEEAQTRLLFPMMGMLFLVMAVVMVPAFFSM